jgi:two-component system cell cycle sensor histidine kinase/response regulator CckA
VVSPMAAVEDPSALAQRIADQIRALLDCYGAAVYRLEETLGALVAVATSGDLGPRFCPGLVFPRGTGIVGLVLLEGCPVTTPNVLSDPRVTLTPDNRALIEQAPYRSVLAVPLIVQGAVIGALSVGGAEGRIFAEAEMTVVQAYADQAAIAIENARLYQESAAHERRLATMVAMARKLTSRLDLASVLDTVAEAAAEVFEAEVGFRLIEGDELVLRRATPGARRSMVRERLKLGESISGRVAMTGEPIVTVDVPADVRAVPEHRQGGDRNGALMCVPLRGGSRILGTLNIYRERGQRFDAAALDLAMSLADQAGVALENARLYHEAQQAYEDLSRAQQQLLQSQKMEAIGRLAGGIAHDFNNLLTVILGRGELLLSRLPATDRARRDIETINKTAERATILTRQLLAFARRQTLQPTVLDLNAVVSAMHTMLRQLIGEDVDLQAVLDSQTGPVMADRGQLEQVLVNLAVNARDAMPAGGRLTIETGNAVLDEAFLRDTPGASVGAHVFVRVSDTGVGIDPAIRPNIFEPFFTTKPSGQGTGLGLSTVDGIVRQHGGSVTVQSVRGQGTAFTVYLPRAVTPEEALPTGAAQPEHASQGRETILLVEDEEELRNLARELLQEAGFTVLAAANGGAALDLCRQHRDDIDLLLTDVVMPGMSGTELAEHVRRSHPEAKVLYMSGYPAHPSGRSERFSVEGAMLAKPFTTATLTEMVRRTLDAG